MNKIKINRLLVIGLSLLLVVRLAHFLFYLQSQIIEAITGFSFGLILAGAVLQVLSYHGKDQSFRQWKQR